MNSSNQLINLDFQVLISIMKPTAYFKKTTFKKIISSEPKLLKETSEEEFWCLELVSVSKS